MKAIASTGRSPWLFFALVFAISIPLWLVGGLIGLQIVPGVPLSSVVVTFCPAVSALALAYRSGKGPGARALLKRAIDFSAVRQKVLFVPLILFMPAVMTLEYWLLRWTGSPIPPPSFPLWMPLAMFAAFFLAGLGEELGWMGYAVDRLQARSSALQAALLLGIVWAAWHAVPVVQVGRPPAWIAWQCLFWISTRVIVVWFYNNTGRSVFAAELFHSMLNVATYLFPVEGTFYDPRLAALIVTALAVIIVLAWGPRTLTRDRAGAADGEPSHGRVTL